MGWIQTRKQLISKASSLLPEHWAANHAHARRKRKYQRGLERNRAVVPDAHIPLVFNQFGEAYDFFFLQDDHYRRNPYSLNSRYFLWDRFNHGLDVHFYTGFNIMAPYAHAQRRYGWLVEAETIAVAEYDEIYQSREIAKEYNRIFTFSQRLLDAIPNAAFVPAGYVRYGNAWYDTASLDASRHLRKSKNISIVSSDKSMCHLHLVRRDLALQCLKNPALGVDVFGTVGGGDYAFPDAHLSEYRFAIAMENDIQKYYFTEKILNCFAAMTIPVYLGAPGIGDFFNEDGIIFLSEGDCSHIEDVLKQCSPAEYERRREAVIDNFNRVQDYLAIENYMYKQYLADDDFFIARKANGGAGRVSHICPS